MLAKTKGLDAFPIPLSILFNGVYTSHTIPIAPIPLPKVYPKQEFGLEGVLD